MVRPEAGQHVDRVGDGWRVRMQGPEEVGVADRGRALVVQDGVASDRPIRPRRAETSTSRVLLKVPVDKGAASVQTRAEARLEFMAVPGPATH